MIPRYVDWNSHLICGLHEKLTDPEDALDGILYLCETYGVNTLCMMPVFTPFVHTASHFILKRDRALERIQKAYHDRLENGYKLNSKDQRLKHIKILKAACVALEPGCHEIKDLHRLAIRLGGLDYLPIRLPITEFHDSIDLEINRLLYRAGFHLWFVSFDVACTLYPPEIIQKLMRIKDSVFQFNYRSLEDPEIREIIQALLDRNVPVLLGTSLDCPAKAYHYDISYYASLVEKYFSKKSQLRLMRYYTRIPSSHPKIFMI